MQAIRIYYIVTIALVISLGTASTSVHASSFFRAESSIQSDVTRSVSYQSGTYAIKRVLSPWTSSSQHRNDSSDKVSASTPDAVSHVSAISICNTTIAVLLGLIHVGHYPVGPIFEFYDQTIHHRVLFESIIAPNAP